MAEKLVGHSLFPARPSTELTLIQIGFPVCICLQNRLTSEAAFALLHFLSHATATLAFRPSLPLYPSA